MLCKSKKRNLVLFVLLNFLIGVELIAQDNFVLRGCFNNQDSGYALLSYYSEETGNRKRDTAKVNNGCFKFKGTVLNFNYADLEIYHADSTIKLGKSLLFDKGENNVVFQQYEDNQVALFTDTRSQKELNAFDSSISDLEKNRYRLSDSIQHYRNLLQSGKNTFDENKRTELINEFIINSKAITNRTISYILNRCDSPVSLHLLYFLVGSISNDSIDYLYLKLTDEIKNSTLNSSFLRYYSKYRKAKSQEYPFDLIDIGEKAPDFIIYRTPDLQPLNLATYKNKILILEFWRLTCYPCLKVNPLLDSLLKRYKADDLEIIAINDDPENDMPKLVKYIKNNRLNDWIHISTNSQKPIQGLSGGDFSAYHGLAVPRTVIIDRNGIIVHKSLGYSSSDFEALAEVIRSLSHK